MYILWLHLLLLFPWSISAQGSVTVPLNNTQISSNTLALGGIQHYFFEASSTQNLLVPLTTSTTPSTSNSTLGISHINSALNVRSKQSSKIVRRAGSVQPIYLTVSVCTQPQPPSNYQGQVPPLQVFISTSSSNSLPGPSVSGTSPVNNTHPGYVYWDSTASPTDQLWIGVSAPTLTQGWTGNWTYQLGVSTTAPMHQLLVPNGVDDSIPYMTLDDTDNNNALFLSSSYQGSQAPNFTVMITSEIPSELSYSECAAQKLIQSHPVNYTATTRGPFNATRQQAYVSGLSPATKYTAFYIQPRANNLPSAYGAPISVITKSETNCRLVYGLSFCNQVAYSVVTSPNDPGADIWNLTESYDQNAQQIFQPFATALSQFNCETTQYSLVRNCTDCYNDYKNWICSVLIPRCTSPSPFNQADTNTNGPSEALREVPFNQSRNPWIDQTYSPNEWTELLPCIDLCYRVVQSCPPFMQFGCPYGDIALSQYGYWQTGPANQNGTNVVFDINNPTCNRMGINTSFLVLSESPLSKPVWILTAAMLISVSLLM
ncbi:Centractin [Umbelopsis sp. WA50703]